MRHKSKVDEKPSSTSASIGMTLLAIMAVDLVYVLFKQKDASVLEILFYDFFIIWVVFVSVMASEWNVSLEENTLIFRNRMLWLLVSKFTLKEITHVKIVKSRRERSMIYISTAYEGERMYFLENNQAKQLTLALRERGIKVNSYIDEIINPA